MVSCHALSLHENGTVSRCAGFGARGPGSIPSDLAYIFFTFFFFPSAQLLVLKLLARNKQSV